MCTFKTEKIKPWNFDLIHEKLKLQEYDDIFESFKDIKKGIEKKREGFSDGER